MLRLFSEKSTLVLLKNGAIQDDQKEYIFMDLNYFGQHRYVLQVY